MRTFKVGQKYGNDLTVEITKRTAKFVFIKSAEFGERRVKIQHHADTEVLFFKCWIIEASEKYNEQKSVENAVDKAYYF